MYFLGQVKMAPRPVTVYPGTQGRHPVAVPTRPGWPAAVPPYVTYPVDNVAWGQMDPPPFQAQTFDPTTELPPKAPAPASRPAVPPKSSVPANGPLPISDWFGLLQR
jgi:hypothetical protein